MFPLLLRRTVLTAIICQLGVLWSMAQNNIKLKYENSLLYAGIDIGSKGVKLSVLEIGQNAQKNGAFNILKDTAINTDFISFDQPSFDATLIGLYKLFEMAEKEYKIPVDRIFTVISSGIKSQSDKENKSEWINRFIDTFRKISKDSKRQMPIIDVKDEARLSHLGIIPESRRYNTFLIDIGSGNCKGGYFPNGNTSDLKLFQLSWGTKSTANATEKRLDNDKSLANYKKQLERLLLGVENNEIVYAVNASGAYPVSDNIAFSGGIAWSLATIMYPELIDNSVVPVTYNELEKFNEKLFSNFESISDSAILQSITDTWLDKIAISREVKKVYKVFEQKALLAGTGLLLKIMRQFEGIYERKQFYLVKNGQVGWISAYVNNTINK